MKELFILLAIIAVIILFLPFVLIILSGIVQLVYGLWINAWKLLATLGRKGVITMDKNLTDAEIKKALECCAKETVDCENCPANREFVYWQCFDEVKILTVDLINRQEEEIERLKAEIKFSDYLEYETTNQIKAEAYKEFAERLKEKFARQVSKGYCKVLNDFVDNLLKELEGENNAET